MGLESVFVALAESLVDVDLPPSDVDLLLSALDPPCSDDDLPPSDEAPPCSDEDAVLSDEELLPPESAGAEDLLLSDLLDADEAAAADFLSAAASVFLLLA